MTDSAHTLSVSEISNAKRKRTGSVSSISGRLRTASDLEECGLIDKTQKGIMKDLIISGDSHIQSLLDRYEKGDKSALEELLSRESFARRFSVDLLDGLDFDFLNGMKTDDMADAFENEHLEFPPMEGSHPPRKYSDFTKSLAMFSEDVPKNRNSSIDSTTSFKLFDNFPLFRSTSFGDANDLHGVDVDHHLFLGDEEHDLEEPGDGEDNHVDMSAYSAMAAQLQAKGTGGAIPKNVRSCIRCFGFMGQQRFRQPQGAADGGSNPYKRFAAPSYRRPADGSPMPAPADAAERRTRERQVQPGGGGGATIGVVPSRTDVPVHRFNSSVRPDGSAGTGFIGAYSPEERRLRLQRFFEKRNRRVWTKKVKYDVRKNFADSRLRVKGRFVKKEDEDLMRELLNI